MRFTLPLLLLAATASALGVNYTAPGYSAYKLYQLSNGTWISDIASPESSYSMRMTLFDRPEVYEVDPTHQHGGPRSIHRFNDSYGLTSITDLSYNQYAVIAMSHHNYTTSASIWLLRLDGTEPEAVRIIDRVGKIDSLGALTTLSPTVVLACQPSTGLVYRIDLLSRAVDPVYSDQSMYWMHYKAPYLYYTNLHKGLFLRVPLDPHTADPTGEPEVIASSPLLVGTDRFVIVDDSTDEVDAFLVNFEKGSLVRVRNGDVELAVQGIAMPTIVQLGDDGGLYLATAGRAPGESGASIWSISFPKA